MRKIKYWLQRRIRGWSDDECWNLDWQFIVWLNSRLKVYKEQADKYVDLSFHKFIYKGEEKTQGQLIDTLINLTEKIVSEDKYFCLDDIEKLDRIEDEIYDIFKLIHRSLWW